MSQLESKPKGAAIEVKVEAKQGVAGPLVRSASAKDTTTNIRRRRPAPLDSESSSDYDSEEEAESDDEVCPSLLTTVLTGMRAFYIYEIGFPLANWDKSVYMHGEMEYPLSNWQKSLCMYDGIEYPLAN
jgi:hypothetical protein